MLADRCNSFRIDRSVTADIPSTNVHLKEVVDLDGRNCITKIYFKFFPEVLFFIHTFLMCLSSRVLYVIHKLFLDQGLTIVWPVDLAGANL